MRTHTQLTGTHNSIDVAKECVERKKSDTKENVLNKPLYRKFKNSQESSVMTDIRMVVISGWIWC